MRSLSKIIEGKIDFGKGQLGENKSFIEKRRVVISGRNPEGIDISSVVFPDMSPKVSDINDDGDGEDSRRKERKYTESEVENIMEQKIAELEDNFKKRCENIREEAIEEGKRSGFRDGYDKGHKEGISEMERIKSSLNKFMDSLESAWEKIRKSAEEELIQGLFAIVEHLLLSDSIGNEGVIKKALEESSKSIMGEKELIIKINPADRGEIENIVPGLFSRFDKEGRIFIKDNNSIKRGGCILETDLGTIDATIETRWEQFVKRLPFDIHKRNDNSMSQA